MSFLPSFSNILKTRSSSSSPHSFLSDNTPDQILGLSNGYGLGSVTSLKNFDQPNFSHSIQTVIQTRIEKVTSDEFTTNIQQKNPIENDNLKITFDINDFDVDVTNKDSLSSLIDLQEDIYINLNGYKFKQNRNIRYYVYFPDVFNKPENIERNGRSQVILVIGYFSESTGKGQVVTREQYMDVYGRLDDFFNKGSSLGLGVLRSWPTVSRRLV